MNLLPRAEFFVRCPLSVVRCPLSVVRCPLSALERVHIVEVFLKEMYENFVGT